ncbi:MAG: 30S ribosomal protein S20 [Tissierellia bacterium]|nr:30S ribosomal protein S20 [Tissierellia bacterium]
MANIKSAIKRIKVNQTKNNLNKSKRSELKTYIRRLNEAIDENKIDEARELLKSVDKKLKKAADKNIIHKNSAARQISRLSKKINKKANEAV